jgi:antitoxin component YwqK of YwqJK toxin-antitoxin module
LKLVAALLITLSYASIISAQTPASTCEPPEMSDLVRDKLKGPIKTIKTFKTVFFVSKKTGRLEKWPRELENETEYDANGERPRGGITFIIPGDMEFNGIRYVCADNGKLKELRFVANDGSTFPRRTYVYDEKGRTTVETGYFQNGSIEGKTTYVYDAAGNMVEEVNTIQVHPEHFCPMRYDVYVTTKATYKYDARGNKLEEKHFYPDGSLATTWFFGYDSRDRLIKRTRIDNLGRLVEQVFYEYHADGRLLREIWFHNSCYTREDDFCKGYISSGDGFFHYATQTRHRYDSQGNWIKQTEWSMDGELKKPVWRFSQIVEREITYHRN